MKKISIILGSSLVVFSLAYAHPVHDWKDLHKVHEQVKHAIEEMGRARAANHYDMDGHGAKAEELLRQAESELNQAVEAAKRAK